MEVGHGTPGRPAGSGGTRPPATCEAAAYGEGMVEVRLLGPLEVVAEDGEVVTPSAAKERMLLAVMALSGGVAVPPDRLAEILWGDAPPPKTANALQARVSALRRSLGDRELISHEPGGYLLALDPARIDAHRFCRVVSDARRTAETAPGHALALFDEACSLWRGEALADFAYEDFARPHITRLDEVRLDAQEERLRLMADYGRCEEAVAEVEILLEVNPFRERLWAVLMLALYRLGRQVEALRAFQKASRILGEELGIEPSEELRRLEEDVLLQDADLTGAGQVDRPAHNLPVRLTSLVGRDPEIDRITRLFDDHRSVTLVGPGGVGKTSLGLACGHELVARFPDGVWLAEFSALEEPGQVPVELARTLNLDTGDRSTLEAVVEHLNDRRALLILDNCEPLLDGVAEATTTLLQRAPGVFVLATSREPLGIPGEILWPTRPLSLPDEDSEVSFADSAAVRLFVDRARAVDPDFATEDNESLIAEICRRLDGLPLAVELAAARIRNLPVAEIARRLEDRFAILTGGVRTVVPRHQTLEATIAWSFDSLSEEERSLFARLSVFSGGWTLSAAEAVASDPPRVLDLLSRLVDRSLVNVGQIDGVARYSMLETIRAFASQTLAETGEQEEVMLRHARWFLELAESAELQGTSQSHWISRLSSEYENLRAAIGYASRCGDSDTALRLGGALGWWWFFGNRAEGRTILDELLSQARHHSQAHRIPVLQARALLDFFGASPRTIEVAEEALVRADTLDDPSARAMSKVFVALGGVFGASVDRSMGLLHEAITVFAGAQNRFAEGLARFQRMEVLGNRGSLREAFEEGEVALGLFAEAADPWAVSVTYGHLGRYGRLTGQLERAEEATATSIEMARDQSLPHTLQYALTDQAYVTYLQGDLNGALRLFERALAVARAVGNRMGIGTIHNGMAEVSLASESVEDARRLHLQAADEFADLALDKWWAYSLTRLGLVEESAGNRPEAADCHAQALQATSTLPGSIGVTLSMEGLARVAACEGDLERAVPLLYGARELRRRGGLAPTPPEAEATHSTEQIVRNAVNHHHLRSLASELENAPTAEIAALAS